MPIAFIIPLFCFAFIGGYAIWSNKKSPTVPGVVTTAIYH
jgi:hypothetical protein